MRVCRGKQSRKTNSKSLESFVVKVQRKQERNQPNYRYSCTQKRKEGKKKQETKPIRKQKQARKVHECVLLRKLEVYRPIARMPEEKEARMHACVTEGVKQERNKLDLDNQSNIRRIIHLAMSC